MESENQKKVGAGKLSGFERMEKVPPIKMVLYVSMAGMGLLFLVLTTMFLSRVVSDPAQANFPLPKLFSVSTVLLLVSGFFMQQVPVFYAQDELPATRKHLMWSLVLGFAFTMAQVMGWYEMATSGVFFAGKAAGTFLYLISALHLLHVAGGLAFSSYLFVKVNHAAADPIRTLVFNRDPFRLLQFQMLRSYWHFLDGFWLALYFIFLFSL